MHGSGVTYPKHALLSDQLDKSVLDRTDGIALTIGGDVPQVADVALSIGGRTVGLGEGVDCEIKRALASPFHVEHWKRERKRESKRTVRASRGAAVGVVTELVDVEATLGAGVVAGDVPGDGGGPAIRTLLEGDGALDVGVTAEDSN